MVYEPERTVIPESIFYAQDPENGELEEIVLC